MKQYRQLKEHLSQSQKFQGLVSGMRLTFCAVLGNLLHSLGLSLLTWQIRGREIKRLRLAHPISILSSFLTSMALIGTATSTFPNLPNR